MLEDIQLAERERKGDDWGTCIIEQSNTESQISDSTGRVGKHRINIETEKYFC